MPTTIEAEKRPSFDAQANVRQLAANTVRTLSMDGVQRANSGHPGMPMGMADVAVVLWSDHLSFDPSATDWPNRDRFVLSAGHGSMLLYSLLHIAGFDLSIDDLKQFRQWGSKTPGHPEYGHTPGVETTTGPLGQGLANAVGMALAERHLAAKFNRPGFDVVDHYTYAIASDGDFMEGVTNEASSLAGHLGLGRLIVLYDDNGITIDGSTDLAFTEDVLKRYEALGWHTEGIDGHDHDEIHSAIHRAKADNRPSIIACRTHIGYGSPNKQDTASAHGSPLGDHEIQLTKEALGWEGTPFSVPDDVYALMRGAAVKGESSRSSWNRMLATYAEAWPELHSELDAASTDRPVAGWTDALRSTFETGTSVATRKASGAAISTLKKVWPMLIGGSADLTPSNNTMASDDAPLTRDNYAGRYIHFGIREHAMASMMNGLNVHGGVRAYGGTFLVFSDYMRPAIRLAALMDVPSLFVFTHDSIGLGEDGPTHQPVEHAAALRAIPNLAVFRPADANETVRAWDSMTTLSGPSAILLTRQGLPVLDWNATAGADKGGYILSDRSDPEVIILSSGSEVHIALEAQDVLDAKGVAARVVSMPCWELFDLQSADYRKQVLPPSITARVSIEAGVEMGWHRYLGLSGVTVALDRFGASAPYKDIYENLGITAAEVVKAVRSAIARAEIA